MTTYLFDWKGILYGILAFLSQLVACDSAKQYHQPDQAANHKVVAKTNDCGSEQIAETQAILTTRLESNRIFYQSVESDLSKSEITFNIIGHDTDYVGEPQFLKVLSQKAAIKFATAINISDSGVLAQMDTIIAKEQLGNLLQVNRPQNGRTILSGPAALIVVNVEASLKQIKEAFSRHQDALPYQLIWSEDKFTNDPNNRRWLLYAYKNKPQTIISEKNITLAEAQPNNYGGIEVLINFDGNGTKQWGEMTTNAAYDNNRQILIIVNDEVLSAPMVNEPILGGKAAISGGFTLLEADQLAQAINAGNPPCDFKVIKLE